MLLLAAVAGLLGYWLGTRQVSWPGVDSAEVGFARDMMQHHAQAVDMASLLMDRTDDLDLRLIALDIQLTQQGQIGQMQGWLHLWGYPLTRTGPAMSWMGMPTTGSMPGMATPEQLNELRGLGGHAAEVLFLQLMIPHHVAGVEMAQAALDLAKEPAVRNLAQSIVDAQTSEIEMMQVLPTPLASVYCNHDIGGLDHCIGRLAFFQFQAVHRLVRDDRNHFCPTVQAEDHLRVDCAPDELYNRSLKNVPCTEFHVISS
jgi:uncharacterized protein (DUF305 family)